MLKVIKGVDKKPTWRCTSAVSCCYPGNGVPKNNLSKNEKQGGANRPSDRWLEPSLFFNFKKIVFGTPIGSKQLGWFFSTPFTYNFYK